LELIPFTLKSIKTLLALIIIHTKHLQVAFKEANRLHVNIRGGKIHGIYYIHIGLENLSIKVTQKQCKNKQMNRIIKLCFVQAQDRKR